MVPYTNRDYLAYLSDFITELTAQVIRDFRGTATISIRLFPALDKCAVVIRLRVCHTYKSGVLSTFPAEVAAIFDKDNHWRLYVP